MTSEWLGILGYIINIKGGNIVSNAGFSFAADVNICDASVNVKDVIFSEIGSINIARSKVIIDSSEQALVCNSIKIDKNSLISAGDNSSNVKTICADRESTDNISSSLTQKYVAIYPYVCAVGNINGTRYTTLQAAIDDLGTTETTIYLILDDIENVTIPSKKNITLDLNGHYLLGKDTGFSNVIEVCEESSPGANDAAKLTVVDSSADGLSHNFEVSDSGLWVLTDKAYTKTYEDLVNNPAVTGDVIKVTGGVITSDNSSDDTDDYFRGIYVDDDAYLTLKSGNIIGNGNSGVINYGNFVMDGGLIAGNLSQDSYGAGVHNKKSFVMKGGKITNNIPISESGGVGGVNIADSKSSFTMTDGTISANEGAFGGVGNGGTLKIGGSAKIYGNNGSFGNNLVTIGLITIGDSTDGSDGNTILKPASGFNVGITLLGFDDESGPYAKTGQFTENGNSSDKQYFFSDSLAYKVKYNEVTGSGGYLELVNYDINAVASNTASVTLEKDDMTEAQAIAIAKNQKPYTELSKDTVIAYAKDTDFATNGKYLTTKADTTNDWAAGTAMTLAEMKADSAKDYFVIGTVTNHTHSWTYAEGGTGKENTLLAYCSAANCDGTAISAETAETLTIVAPNAPTYDGTAKAATIKDGKTSLGGLTTLPDIQYQKKTGKSTYDTASTTAPTAAGTYKASITVDTDKTAYVEYTISAPLQPTPSSSDSNSKTVAATGDAAPIAFATLAVLAGLAAAAAVAAGFALAASRRRREE